MRTPARRSSPSSSLRWACECTLVAAAALTTILTCLEAWTWATTKFPAPRRIVHKIGFDPYVNETCLAQDWAYPSLNLSARVRAAVGQSTHSGSSGDASPAVSLLSIDYHISPIADLKDLLRRHVPNAVVVDRSLSEACERAGTCATSRTYRMIRRGRRPSMYLTPAARRAFFAAYTDVRAAPRQPTSWVGWLLGEGIPPPLDPLVMHSDALVCSHPTGSCELAMPFNRPAIIWATTRFELGRECNARRMCGYVHNLRALASIPGSVVLANNMYDVHYTQYFTGITPQYVPSYCGYTGAAWRWGATGRSWMRTVLVHGFKPFTPPRAGTHANTSSTMKLAPTYTDSHELLYPGDTHGRGGPDGLINDTIAPDGLEAFLSPLRQAAKAAGSKWRFKSLRVALGSNYTYESLGAFPAVLHLPYQASIMSFFEHYRMGIPILAPSLRLLTRWHIGMRMVGERSWDMAFYRRVSNGSVLPRHPAASAPYDPNDDMDPAAVAWWLQWSDYYTFPHVVLFDSWQDLLDKLNSVDLAAVSAAMRAHSAAQEAELARTWSGILAGLPSRTQRAASDASLHGLSYEQRMDTLFGPQGWADY